jgi:hypothetical protein
MGQIIQLYWDPMVPNHIIGFDLAVRITNDMPSLSRWLDGGNSHEETLTFSHPLTLDMLNVKLTIEFADDGTIGNFPNVGPPYHPAPPPLMWRGSIESNVYAIEYDQLAWYCWTPRPDDPSPFDGQYMVPTWDFGDIKLNESVTRILQFGLYDSVGPGEPLYDHLIALLDAEDVLLNRSTSLKISDYFDVIVMDRGLPYPHLDTEPPLPATSSNCSVFFNIEPPEPPVIVDVERGLAGDIRVSWIGDPPIPMWLYRVESSTDPYDYDENNMTWTTVADNVLWAPVMDWTDTTPPGVAGDEEYYRVFARFLPVDILGPDTAGAMTIKCSNGRNMVSSMFEPYPPGGLLGTGTMGHSTLDKIINGQLTGHPMVRSLSDTIEAWNPMLQQYMRAWYQTSMLPGTWRDWYTNGPPLFGWNSDWGYWINIVLTHPDRDVTLFGRVSKADRSIPIGIKRNLVGSCYPKTVTLYDTGLVASGFIGHAAVRSLSDQVEFWNNSTRAYQRFWYRTSDNTWQPWNTGEPMRDIVPGDGIWVNLPLRIVGFTWNYPVPY